jgi:hypothetical protein
MGKCLSGQTSNGQISSGQISIWATVFLGKFIMGNCLLSKCCSEQIYLGKYLGANVSGQMSDGQMSYHRRVEMTTNE